jgi:hypothetical protein
MFVSGSSFPKFLFPWPMSPDTKGVSHVQSLRSDLRVGRSWPPNFHKVVLVIHRIYCLPWCILSTVGPDPQLGLRLNIPLMQLQWWEQLHCLRWLGGCGIHISEYTGRRWSVSLYVCPIIKLLKWTAKGYPYANQLHYHEWHQGWPYICIWLFQTALLMEELVPWRLLWWLSRASPWRIWRRRKLSRQTPHLIRMLRRQAPPQHKHHHRRLHLHPKSNNTSSSIHNHSSDHLQPNSDPGQETPFTPATQIAATPPHYPPQPGLSSLQEIAQLPASPVNTPSSPNSTDEATIV